MHEKIINSYVPGVTSMRDVAKICGTDHHTVKRVLERNGVQVHKAKPKPLTDEHKRKISEATLGRSTWIKGKKATKEMLYKNMASKLRFDVSWEWLSQFDDVEKLKTLNDCVTNRSGRFDVSTDWYKAYLLKFWHCDRFNAIYDSWVKSGFNHLKKPSIDHIHPVSKSGDNSIDNLQFLTWFENRCKNNMSQTEWDEIKSNINEYISFNK